MDRSFANQSAARDPLIGRVLHDRYRVEKRIGKGGMGIVYLAEHVLLRRKVALKTLSDRAFASDELVARFHREATAAAAVGNEHVVGVTDMGQLEDGSYFVVLEYLEGVELGHAVAEDGPFSVARAASVIMQLCDALSAVHEAGIVHRDLKPENLFLVERNGEPDFLKVLDFGVCKVLDVHKSGERSLTDTGVSLGTPQFMAPEQIEDSAKVDERTDIYAAGAILFYALTGRAPFDEPTLPRLLMRICSEPPPGVRMSRPELSTSLEAVIARAMALDPADRFQTAAAMRDALLAFASGDAAVALAPVAPAAQLSEASSTQDALRAARVRPAWGLRWVAAAVLVCGAVALALAAFVALRRPAPELTTRAEAASEPAAPRRALALDLAPAFEASPPEAPPEPSPRARSEKPSKPAVRRPAPAPPAPAPEPAPIAVPEVVSEAPPVEAASEAPEREPAYRISQRELQDVFP